MKRLGEDLGGRPRGRRRANKDPQDEEAEPSERSGAPKSVESAAFDGSGLSIEETWRTFPDLPGVHMSVRRIISRGESELVAAEGEVLCRNLGRELVLGERHFVARRGGKGLPGSSDAVAPFELIDATSGQQVLSLESRNYNLRASGRVRSSSHCYTFSVRSGIRHFWPYVRPSRFAVMFAVDESGQTVALFRRVRLSGEHWRRVEIALPPTEALSDELILLLTSTAGFLASYFARPQAAG